MTTALAPAGMVWSRISAAFGVEPMYWKSKSPRKKRFGIQPSAIVLRAGTSTGWKKFVMTGEGFCEPEAG